MSAEENPTYIIKPVISGPKIASEEEAPRAPKQMMTDMDYIKERVDDQIDYYNRKSSQNQKNYKFLKRWEFYIATSIPLTITLSNMEAISKVEFGLNAYWGLGTILQVSAAIAGVIVVIINKLLELEEHHKLWKEYRLTCEALQHERLVYLTRTPPYDREGAFPLFVEKVEAILNNETFKWKQSSQQKQSDNEGAKQKN